MKYVTINKASEITGYSEKAIRGKIDSGVWLEGVHYRRAPDHRILINMQAYDEWAEGEITFKAINKMLAS